MLLTKIKTFKKHLILLKILAIPLRFNMKMFNAFTKMSKAIKLIGKGELSSLVKHVMSYELEKLE
jgi:hypothetical protein